MSGENDDVLVKKVVLWLWEALIGDDFSEGLVGGVDFWSEERHRFVRSEEHTSELQSRE